MASALSTKSDRSAVHVPKLKYRQTSYEVSSPKTPSVTSVPIIATSSAQPDVCTSPPYPSSQTSTDPDSRRPSIATSSLAPSRTPDRSLKKRKAFFSTLFATQEPSAKALADYEKQLKTQGTLKNGRIVAVGMPGVSSAKLPPTVPKVNSKWDGTPLTAKEQLQNKGAAASQERFIHSTGNRSLGLSTASLRAQAKRPSSKGTLGGASMHTTRSDGNRNQLADLYGWEIAAFAGTAEGSTSPPSTRATSVRSVPMATTTKDPTIERAEPPEIPKEYFESAISPKPRALLPNTPTHSHSPSLTPKDESPPTPNTPPPLSMMGSAEPEQTLLGQAEGGQRTDDIRTTTVEAPPARDEVIIRSSGVNILSPPRPAKRKPKPSPPDPDTEEQADKALKEPKSILKKESTPSLNVKSQQRLALDAINSRAAALDALHSSPQWKSKLGLGTKVSSYSRGDGAEEPGDRSVTPTPDAGALLHARRSRIGMFKK